MDIPPFTYKSKDRHGIDRVLVPTIFSFSDTFLVSLFADLVETLVSVFYLF